MTERLLKHQRDIVPTGLLAWFVKEWHDFIAFLCLDNKELGILIILDGSWSTLSEIEHRGKSLGLTEEKILAIVDKLVRHGLVECRRQRSQDRSPDSGSVVIAEYRATA